MVCCSFSPISRADPAAAATVPERAGQMPAPEMVTRGGLSHPDAGFERRGERHDHVAPRRFAPLAEREQRGQRRRAGVQDHAAEMRVVEIEHVAHLAVRHRRIQQAELASRRCPITVTAGPEPSCSNVVEQHVDGRMLLPARAQPVQSSTARFASCTAAGDRSS